MATKIDAAGNWLADDAAASYLRMLAAGMPAGGVDVFGRTLAEQWAVYRAYLKGGPLAAYPRATAPHVRGQAIDLHTTTAGKYAPSAAHLWLTEGGDGSSKPKAGEKLRAHEYGWFRTVPSERWHFAYDPARDKHMPGAVTYPATIRKGAKGETVRRLQAALRSAGYRGDLINRVLVGVDGVFGSATERAVKRWQKAHKLTVDGVVGPATWASLGITL